MKEMVEAAATFGDPVNILVVDDTAENRLTLQSILSEPGQDVVTAASGRDALRRLLRQEFAVILLDVNMPVMDGFETAALVRQRKSSERTPIIFITAFSDETHVSRGYSLGAVDYIVSPVEPEVLRSKVAVFVDLFRKTEQIRRQAESLRRRADQLYQLSEASLAINSANSLDEILAIVTETARDLVAARHALTVSQVEPGHAVVHHPIAYAGGGLSEALDAAGLAARPEAPAGAAAALTAKDPVAAPPAPGVTHGRLLQQAAAVTANLADQARAVLLRPREVASDPRWRLLGEGSGAAVSGWLAAPFTGRDGRCIGWVHLAGREREEEGQFSDDDRTILTQLAQVAAIAIENLLSSEAREANRLKDEFLTTLSHELRTPLTAILGWTRVLRTSPADPVDRERLAHGLEVIERNVTAQTKLIEDLLDVSRIIAGKLRVNLRPMPLRSAIETAIEAMRPAAEAKGLTLVLHFSPEVDHRAAIAGDTDRLQQVGWNLVSNAIKFTPPGGHIEVAVSCAAGWYRVAVRDNGKGIHPQFLHHVFDRFRQDDSSSTRAHGGLGIGLAIVQHIVELHGGKVEAESPGPNLGATFTVSLPVLAGAALPAFQAPPALAASAPSDDTGLQGLRVVVVDDEPDTREILSEVLRAAGATVATAGSLSETLALFDRLPPDVLVSDIAMPGGDGYALMRQLRRRPLERGGAVPAIAVSAHAREEDRQRALAAGFGRYVTKPVEPADLLAAVREAAPVRPPEAAAAVPPPPVKRPAPAAPGAAAGRVPAGARRAGAQGGNGRHPARPARAAGAVQPASVVGAATGAPSLPWEAAGAPAPAADPAAPENPVTSRRILLVEDDPDTREALKTLLELSGHQVDVAASGPEGVASAIAKRPEVALVDIGLPEIDGHEVARRIRAQLGEEGIFLVALTGYGGEADEERSRAAGFNAHVTKPVELDRLTRLLRDGGRGGR
jgi:CheY-like chemotaxis protein